MHNCSYQLLIKTCDPHTGFTHAFCFATKTTLYTNLRLMSPTDPDVITVQEVMALCLPTPKNPSPPPPGPWQAWSSVTYLLHLMRRSVRKFRNKDTPRCVCLDWSHCAPYRSNSTTCAGVWVPTAMKGGRQPDQHPVPLNPFSECDLKGNMETRWGPEIICQDVVTDQEVVFVFISSVQNTQILIFYKGFYKLNA